MEIDYHKLEKNGLKLEDRDFTKEDPQKMFCPKCHKNRTHKGDKSLAVYWGSCYAKCFNCKNEFFFGKTTKIGNNDCQPKKQPSMKEKTYHKPTKLANETAPGEEVLAWFASRGIPSEVVTQEGITQAARTFQKGGYPVKCILFPYTVEGELVNRKYRGLEKKIFMLEGGARLVPWRIDHIRHTPECIITEGEMDALSFLVAGRDEVISVPNGAQTNLTWLEDFVETHLENKTRIYIASDTDAKGLELRNELVRRFGEEKCRIVTYGEGCKDANELLQLGGVEAVRKSLEEAQEVPLEGVFTAGDVKSELEILFEKGLQQGATLDMGDLDYLLSVETGRLMVVTGIPGDGKSEFLDEMAVRLSLRYGWRCAWFSPENFPVTLHHPKLMEKLIGKRFK